MTRLPFLLFGLLLLAGCTKSVDDDTILPSFDRGLLLTEYAIQYGNTYGQFSVQAGNFSSLLDGATEALSDDDLLLLRAEFARLYRNWQQVAPLISTVGEAVFLQQRVNTYPVDEAGVIGQVTTPVDLTLPSSFNRQGLPALDYLLSGEDGTLLRRPGHLELARRLARTILELTVDVRDTWNGNFRNEFITNDGNSVTASLDRMVNDLIFNYERFTRAGKVGIPAGIFSNGPLPDRVEAPYLGNANRELLALSMTRTRQLLLGDGRSFTNSLAGYLDALDVRRDGELLSGRIKTALDEIDTEIAGLDEELAVQVETDNAKMLATYDAMQRLLVLLKIDMLQALNINVDYVDADGD